jgi:multimeric flavodoxin WrbA
MRVLVVNASPRRDGNAWMLGEAAAQGARTAGHDVELVHLADSITALLRDCRLCRRAEDDECDIDDGYARLLLDKVVPADAVVFATPLHFYGMSGLLKTFFDRTFCYTATRARAPPSSPPRCPANGSPCWWPARRAIAGRRSG